MAVTGFRLFHNHLTVNALRPIFEFGTPPFGDVLHRLRLDVFETAMRAGIDLIFTNNSAWAGANSRERFATFADRAAEIVDEAGGRIVFVHLTAPAHVLENRVADESRRVHDKLVEVGLLRQLLAELDPSPLHRTDLSIDTSALTPEAAVDLIAVAINRAGSTPG